jgi:hypothetical protein
MGHKVPSPSAAPPLPPLPLPGFDTANVDRANVLPDHNVELIYSQGFEEEELDPSIICSIVSVSFKGIFTGTLTPVITIAVASALQPGVNQPR